MGFPAWDAATACTSGPQPGALALMKWIIEHYGDEGAMNWGIYQSFSRIPIGVAVTMEFVGPLVLAAIGFRRIVFLNGHYDNTYAIAYACAAASSAGRLPAGANAFPVNYWDGMTPGEAGEFFGPTAGLHANRAETSAVMAIDPALVDLDAANAELPPFPEVTNAPAVHTAVFFSAPGSVHRASASGTWGDARETSVEYGERYLQVVTDATARVLDDIERTFAAMPPR